MPRQKTVAYCCCWSIQYASSSPYHIQIVFRRWVKSVVSAPALSACVSLSIAYVIFHMAYYLIITQSYGSRYAVGMRWALYICTDTHRYLCIDAVCFKCSLSICSTAWEECSTIFLFFFRIFSWFQSLLVLVMFTIVCDRLNIVYLRLIQMTFTCLHLYVFATKNNNNNQNNNNDNNDRQNCTSNNNNNKNKNDKY